MLRNVLLLITGTKRKCKTKPFLVYDENGEENASFDVRDFTTRHKHLSKREKKHFRFSTVTGMLTI